MAMRRPPFALSRDAVLCWELWVGSQQGGLAKAAAEVLAGACSPTDVELLNDQLYGPSPQDPPPADACLRIPKVRNGDGRPWCAPNAIGAPAKDKTVKTP